MGVIGKSKTGLNLSRAADIPLYSSDRIAQLTGNGCLTFVPRIPEFENLFAENEVAYFDDADSLVIQIKKYLGDDAARIAVAEAGWRRAHGSYNEKRITKFLVEASVGGTFSESYEWLYASLPKAG